jgi:hypothetical protein
MLDETRKERFYVKKPGTGYLLLFCGLCVQQLQTGGSPISIRRKTEELFSHCVGDASEIKSLGDPPSTSKVHICTTEGFMASTQRLIAQAYSAFNHRDIDSALALMSEKVSWPKASEGGRVVGNEEARSYWTRQRKEFDSHVEPLEVIEQEGGITDVKVHRLVKSLGSDVLSDSEVWHVYTIATVSLNAWTSRRGKQVPTQAHPQHSPDTSMCQDRSLLPDRGRRVAHL